MNKVTKQELRTEMKNLRKSLDDATIEKKSDEIFENLKNLSFFNEAEHIMSFMTFNSEVDTQKINESVLEEDKKLLLPRVVNKITMLAIENDGLFERSALGILEPCGEDYHEEIDFIIVPGLAFDLEGNRLGYGRGYYDRFFEKYPRAIRCAICFSEQIVELVPTEEHDKKMDYIITEKNIYKINRA